MTRIKTRLLAAAALTALSAGPALAAGPLANCQSGVPFRWSGTIPFNPDQGDLGPVDAAAAVALIDQAFQVWQAVPTATAEYANAGLLPVDVDITNFAPFLDPVAPDGLSAIVFDDTGEIFNVLFGPGSGILGFAGPEWVDDATCTITEGVSFLNGPSFTDLTAALDVMVHEFGHYSNLAHTVVNGQAVGLGDSTGPSPANSFGAPPPVGANVIETMFPFYFGPGSGTASLHRDDAASLSTLYPDASFASSTGAISGTILAPNGSTRLTGVNVIARNVADPFDDAVSAISSDFTDSTSQADPVVGTYRIEGLTPGATYAVYVDRILQGGFSTTPLGSLPGPEEFWNGANESAFGDDPTDFVGIAAAAGAEASGRNIIFNAPAPGQPLPVGDDGAAEIFLPFAFGICGQSFESVFINANGNLTFGAASADFSETAPEMLSGPPRIAGLWDDLNPGAGGSVSFSQTPNSMTVNWDNVPEFGAAGGSNTFAITLRRASNHVDIQYGGVSAPDGIAGVSCGGAVTAGDEPSVDLTAFAPDRINLQNSPAVFEQFAGASVNDLANALVPFNGTTTYNDEWAGPNDSFSAARRISLPFDSRRTTRFTEIEPVRGDVDYFRFRVRNESTLIADIARGGFDSVIGLFDASGSLVAFDDDGGAGMLSRIIASVTPGDYVLAVSAFPDVDFTGDGGGGGRYILDVRTVDGVIIALGDDGSQEIGLGFSFPYQGQSWSSVFINGNGNLTFGSGDSDFSESVAELLSDQPRIAGLWDDLNPSASGLVIVDAGASSVQVTFANVPEFGQSTANTFSMMLDAGGAVRLTYGAVAALDGLVGISPGGGAADPGEIDLSAGGAFPAAGVTYEVFTGAVDPFDLDNAIVTFNP